jgi:PAS domain S-box-containing protein
MFSYRALVGGLPEADNPPVSLAAELSALQAQVTPALELLRVPAVLLDADGRIRWLNAAGVELFGQKRGRHYTEIVAPPDTRLARESFVRKILGGPTTDYRMAVLGAAGDAIPVEVSSVGLRHGSRVVGVFGLLKPVERAPRPRPPRFRELTARQYEVLRYLGDGCATRDIAREMGISEDTVRNHVRGVLKALRAHSRLEAVAAAHAAGLLD